MASVQGRPRVRIPALKGETIASFSATLPFTAARKSFRHPDFLGKCSQECTAFLGSLVYCRPPWASQRAVLLLHHHYVQLSRFSLLQRRRFCCSSSNRPMALGLARDDPLAGAPTLDAHLKESKRASAPMEKGTNGFSAGPFGCPEPSFFAVLGLPVKALDGGIPESDCVWVFCCRRSDTAFLSHLSPVARECCVDLASSAARWTHMVTHP